MGTICPPIPLTKKEFVENNGIDYRLEHWIKYERNPLVGLYYFIKEKVFKIQTPNNFWRK